jgi:hypothetical protein
MDLASPQRVRKSCYERPEVVVGTAENPADLLDRGDLHGSLVVVVDVVGG